MIKDIGKHYLYRHIRLDTNEVFYIGLGTKCKDNSHSVTYARAYTRHERNPIWKNITYKTKYKVEILLESDNYEFIKEKEVEFVQLYGRKDLGLGTLVNMTNGGDGMLGHIFSEKHRKNLSNARKGMKLSDYTKRKQSESKKGILLSKEHKEKLSKAKLGHTPTKESVEKSSKNRQKKIKQFTKNNEFIKEWESILIASKTLDINNCQIGQVCKGKQKSAGGFIWEYANNKKNNT
jgi:hypothetical protein